MMADEPKNTVNLNEHEDLHSVAGEKGKTVLVEMVQEQITESNVTTLAQESLSIRSKATRRLILVTFVWGLSQCLRAQPVKAFG